MKRLVITFVSMLALAVVGLAAAASPNKQTVGPAFSILTGHPTTFEANSAFHIENCWNLSTSADAIGKFSIVLDVDGMPRAEDFKEVLNPTPDTTLRCWVWNFPSGMAAGIHTFVEHWFEPCSATTSGTCDTPNADVEEFFGIFNGPPTLTVTFS
jgi:hypothetical protein